MAFEVSCFGAADGQITASIVGGYEPYTLLWSTGDVNNTVVSDLPEGVYELTITDSEGCTDSVAINLVAPPALNLSLLAEEYNGYNTSCFDTNDGQITASPSGGVPSYQFN